MLFGQLIRVLIKSQKYLSDLFDLILPKRYRIDGHQDYMKNIAPNYLKPKLRVYDIGGGKRPFIQNDSKKKLDITIIGLDIDANELALAPKGTYDEVICSDITKYKGKKDADLVICQALLEHVKNIEEAFSAIASILKPEGIAAIFVPSRNAIYSRLNIILPEKLKRRILFSIFPEKIQNSGFPSYYKKCTPKDFMNIAKLYNLTVIEKRLYFISSYFSFLFPIYFLWRIWILIFSIICPEQSAETFSIVFKKAENQ